MSQTRQISIKKQNVFIGVGLGLALCLGLLSIITESFLVPIIPILVLGLVIFITFIFKEPLVGLLALLAYCFFMAIPDRELGGLPYGTGVEIILVITWLSVWYNAHKFDFSILKNDLVYLTIFWFAISCLQLVNPAGASPRGWLQEIRSAALAPLFIMPLAMLLINTKKRLNLFLVLILAFSLLASLNGLKQLYMGLSPGEQAFIDDGGAATHLINGKLRIFSFYSDASQFGPAQAYIGVIALILSVGLKSRVKKIILIGLALISFQGMLVSGTRSAFFTLAVGVMVAILLSKNLRALIIGGGISLLGFIFLKFTYIGNTNYHIYRLRTALEPQQDASFNLRLINQLKLRDYLASRPFGGGLGVTGHWGMEYNTDKYLSTIAPDSYWVKVWAMYGIVGLIFFFGMWMYILGKCGAMVWKVEDRNLKVKLIALIAGAWGIFVCSYGNEVMNAMPSLVILQISLGAIYVMCKNYKTLNKEA